MRADHLGFRELPPRCFRRLLQKRSIPAHRCIALFRTAVRRRLKPSSTAGLCPCSSCLLCPAPLYTACTAMSASRSSSSSRVVSAIPCSHSDVKSAARVRFLRFRGDFVEDGVLQRGDQCVARQLWCFGTCVSVGCPASRLQAFSHRP